MPSDELAPSSVARVKVQKTDSDVTSSDSVVVEEVTSLSVF
jgi:FdhD protein